MARDAVDPDHPNRPSNSAFKQQRLKAWQPILTPRPVIAFFVLVGLLFVPLGAIFYAASENTQEVIFVYSETDKCGDGSGNYTAPSHCVVNVTIPDAMPGPVYFYYRLTNYYQNHRRYVKSRDDRQLRGEVRTYAEVQSSCDPIVSRDNSEKQEDVYFPCGLIAWSYFNDEFKIRNAELNEKGIAWPSDVNSKFQEPEGPVDGAPIQDIAPLKNFNVTDEHFIVWMRTAALPTFRKLYGVIENGLEKGVYQIEIENRYPVHSFNGTKAVVFATTSWLGGKNNFLGIAYMVVGSLSLLIGIAFMIKHITSPRKLGDTSYLRWSSN